MTTTRDIMGAIRQAPKAAAPKPGPVLGGDRMQSGKEALFGVVRQARDTGKAMGLAERVTAGEAVSAGTAATYAATTARRIDLDAEGGGRLMAGVSAASWHATKAALLWGASRAWHHEMRAQDAAQKAGDVAGAVRHARRALIAAQVVGKIEAAEKPQEPKKRRASKRASLPKAPDWQARVYEAATEAQRPAVALLWATGCRPAEIGKGVDVMRDDKGRLLVRIPGAKVRDAHSAGQPFRLLMIDEGTAAGAALAAILGDELQVTIKRSPERINKDFAKIRERIGGKASPYSMRHQVAADLKATLGPNQTDNIAAALGHRSTRSQGRYGSVQQAKGASSITAARATHPVRDRRSAPEKAVEDPGPGL